MCVILIKHWKQGYAITTSFYIKRLYTVNCAVLLNLMNWRV